MKIVKCNRCGKDIPQYSPMTNAVTCNYPIVRMTVLYQWFGAPMEIDLCDDCSKAVAQFANPAQKVECESCT